MASRTLSIQIIGDPDSFTRATRKVSRDADRMGKDVDRSGKRLHGFATVTSKGFGRVGVAAGGMAVAGAGAAALLAKSFVSGASDINESLTKNQVLFGRFADDIDRFSKRSAANFGISRSAALEYTGVFGNLFRATGVARGESAKFSVQLTKLAADMASFNNTSIEDALEAIRSGIVGETEPLRRFGVNLNDAQLRTEALRQGIVKTTKEALTPQQKALAAQALIVKQTAAAHGDFARTSSGLANQQRILKARLADAGAELGGKLLPSALKAVQGLNSLFDSSSKGGRVIRSLGNAANTAANWVKGAFNDIVTAVRRFANRNREELQTAQQAMRNLGRAAKFVFEEIILPTIRTAIRRIGPILDAFKDTVSGLVRFVTNVLTGRWGKAWDAFKDIVKGNFRLIFNILRGAVETLGTLAVKIGGAIVKGVVKGLGSIGHAILGRVKEGISWAAKQTASFLDKANPFNIAGKVAQGIGDGTGRAIGKGVLPSGGAFGGSLMGARPAMKPFAAIGSRFGLQVSSGRRPGAITSSGNTSWHSTGEAIDMSGPPSGMLRFAQTLRGRFGGRLAELIYTPMGAGIKDGRPHRYTGKVAADHFDHVHVAFDSGRPGIGDGLGRFDATSYGPPWGGIQGTGVTATGVNLKSGPRRYGIAVDPNVIPLGSRVKVTPNPFGYTGFFEAFDTGGAIKGNRIDFYDWRGRAAQNRWGHRSVTISTDEGGRSSRGSSRLTPRQRAARGAFQAFSQGQRSAAGAAAREVTLTGPGFAGTYEQQIANVGVQEAAARAKDNLPALIKALQREINVKRRRLKRVKRALKKRIRRDTRARLTEERGQLISEIAELAGTLKEYRADAAGGATTITAAESLEAGVAPEGQALNAGGTALVDVAEGPTQTDFLNAAIAEASLTPGLEDDIAATEALFAGATNELNQARASGDPRRIQAAIEVWKAVKASLDELKGAVNLEAETRQRLIDELAGLKDEIKKQNEFSRSVAGIATREAIKALADVISGQIVGTGLQGRRLTAGNGTVALTP